MRSCLALRSQATLQRLAASQGYVGDGQLASSGPFFSGESTAMCMFMAARPVVVYRVLDGAGQEIGEVVRPKSSPVMGRGAGTVLLIRGEEERRSDRLVPGRKGQRDEV